MIFRTTSLLLCVSAALLADQVVLKNGDIITGSVILKDGGTLTLKSEFLGEVSIPWSAIKTLTTDQELTVVLPGGEAVKGKLVTSGENVQVAGKTAPMAGVTAIRNDAEQAKWQRMEHPGLGQLWAGSFDLGLALAAGNARTETLTNNFVATRVTRHDKISVHFNQLYGKAEANKVYSTIASAIRGGWAYNRDLGPRLFVTTLNEYEHDRFQSLDLRAVFGGGFGVNAYKKDTATLSFQGGGDYSYEKFMTGLNRNSAEANFGEDLGLKLSKVTTLTQAWRFYPNLSNTGEYRMSFDMTGATAIKKWLAWQLSISDRYQSNPLLGRQRNDLLLSTGFRLSFAR